MHITQGDYDGKAVIISWVTPDEPGSSKVNYGTSEKNYDRSAEGTITNYTFHEYKSGYIHHCLVDDLEVTIYSIYESGKTVKVHPHVYIHKHMLYFQDSVISV